MKLPSVSSNSVRLAAAQRGSTLVLTLITLAVLAAAVSAIAISVSTTANVSLQAASWQEALLAAEAGADTAMASFRVALDETSYWNSSSNALTDFKTGATAWTSWLDNTASPTPATTPTTASTPKKLCYTSNLRLATNNNTALVTAVTIEAPTGWTDSAGQQWYRVRSTGAAGVAGPPRVGSDKRDNDLRHISLLNTRSAGSGFPSITVAGNGRQVSRSIELIVKPLQNGIWDRAITVGGTVNISAKFTIDSFDSSDPAKSTNGQYDVTKRQSNADLASNQIGSQVKIGGAYVYGDITYNTGAATGTSNVQGTNTNNFYQQLVGISTPTWPSSGPGSYTNTTINGNSATLNGGPVSNPARYKVSDLVLNNSNQLTFQDNGNGGNKYVEIWVTGDLKMSNTAQIILPSGYYVTFYIAGKLAMSGGSMINGTGKAENLTIYGIDTGNNTTPLWQYGSTSDFIGTIYGKSIEFKVTSSANFYGAVLADSVDFGGTSAAGFHFDEALLKRGSSTTSRYKVASWVEDVR